VTEESCHRLRDSVGLSDVPAELICRALRHSSYVREHGLDELESNQRLEFLGDAVLDVVFADVLYRQHPELPEGDLTRLKAALVRKSALARVAREIGLGEELLLGRGEEATGGRQKASLLADALEALIGAIFLASGWEAVHDFVVKHFRALLSEAEHSESLRDDKSTLQELLQGRGIEPPNYRVIRTDGPAHNRRFSVAAVLGGMVIGSGRGRSKQAAEQAAASAALASVDDWLPEEEQP
jgi:ribonuclease-3